MKSFITNLFVYVLFTFLVIISLSTTLFGTKAIDIPGKRNFRIVDVIAIPVLLVLTLAIGMVFHIPPDIIEIEKLSWILIVHAILVAIVEELCYRFWLPWVLIKFNWSPGLAWTFSIGLFAAVHFWQGWYGVIFAGTVAVIYSFYILKNGSLFVLIIVHILYNIVVMISQYFIYAG